jgi:hypothetical protein
MTIAIWILAAMTYLAFRLWYDGLGKPLTVDEIAHFSQIIQERAGEGLTTGEVATLGKFMEEDDGKEFLMVNLVQFNASPVTHPETGQDIRAPELLTEYTKPFMGKILRRAGHPVIAGQSLGGYLDAWSTPPDPGWHMAGLVRYRSRRDAIELSIADPTFATIHKYKIAAIKQTFAFPIKTQVALYASPRLSVALVVALGASLLQLALT